MDINLICKSAIYFSFILLLLEQGRCFFSKKNGFKNKFNIFGFLGGLFGGGGDGGDTPKPPDPYEMARAQSLADQNTARGNALLLNPGVNSPYGTISYDINKENINGQDVRRPQQTVAFSPGQQEIFNQRQKMASRMGRSGAKMASRLPNRPINTSQLPQRPNNIDFSNVDALPTMDSFDDKRRQIAQDIYNEGWSRLGPDYDLQQKQMDSLLSARGQGIGTPLYMKVQKDIRDQKEVSRRDLERQARLEAFGLEDRLYNRQMMLRGAQEQDAMRPYNATNMIRQDSIGEDALLRNQNLNEMGAILNGTAVMNPSGAPYQQAAMRAPDLAGMINQNYMQQLNAYNRNQDRRNQQDDDFMTGLFTLGGMGLGGMMGGPGGAMMGGQMGGQLGRMAGGW